jgi:hypothetical protein
MVVSLGAVLAISSDINWQQLQPCLADLVRALKVRCEWFDIVLMPEQASHSLSPDFLERAINPSNFCIADRLLVKLGNGQK